MKFEHFKFHKQILRVKSYIWIGKDRGGGETNKQKAKAKQKLANTSKVTSKTHATPSRLINPLRCMRNQKSVLCANIREQSSSG